MNSNSETFLSLLFNSGPFARHLWTRYTAAKSSVSLSLASNRKPKNTVVKIKQNRKRICVVLAKEKDPSIYTIFLGLARNWQYCCCRMLPPPTTAKWKALIGWRCSQSHALPKWCCWWEDARATLSLSLWQIYSHYWNKWEDKCVVSCCITAVKFFFLL